ncbi:mtfA protein [Ihubacter massiliensis]|uniref:mtfA protein n=1 Tax=Ihubacter massiliensis TaxID=1852367 RepID=UPI00209692B1|nr:mtfA protein [Ihubacter massiliensis]MCO7121910.1 mtfA protein [Ihubacter massiliensis]
MMLGLRIGEKHTYEDWGLRWLEPYNIGFPEPQLKEVEVPGSSGVLDLTEAMTGHVAFDQRAVEFNFESADQDYFEYEVVKSQIANYLHGKRYRIVSDLDPHFYYEGRLKFNAEKSSKAESTITLSGDVNPYKFEMTSSAEDWLWDPFSFADGVIRTAKDLRVDGELVVTIPPTVRPCIPVFTPTQDMIVECEGWKYKLKKDMALEVPYIILHDRETMLTFTGYGWVTIDYRGGKL